MWLVDTLRHLVWRIYFRILLLAFSVPPIPAIGEWVTDKLFEIADLLYEVYLWLGDLGNWFEEVRSKLLDLLSWDAILDRIILTLFGGKNPWDWFWDMVWYWLDLYFPWLRDPEFTVWEWVRDRVEMLIPIDIVKPWEVWDLIVDRIRELIPDIPDIGAIATEKVREWIDDHLMAWLEDRAVDIAKMAGRILMRLW